jgi:hypothetical protein
MSREMTEPDVGCRTGRRQTGRMRDLVARSPLRPGRRRSIQGEIAKPIASPRHQGPTDSVAFPLGRRPITDRPGHLELTSRRGVLTSIRRTQPRGPACRANNWLRPGLIGRDDALGAPATARKFPSTRKIRCRRRTRSILFARRHGPSERRAEGDDLPVVRRHRHRGFPSARC